MRYYLLMKRRGRPNKIPTEKLEKTDMVNICKCILERHELKFGYTNICNLPTLFGTKYCRMHISKEPIFTPVIPDITEKKIKEIKVKEETPPAKQSTIDVIDGFLQQLNNKKFDRSEVTTIIESIINNIININGHLFSTEFITNIISVNDVAIGHRIIRLQRLLNQERTKIESNKTKKVHKNNNSECTKKSKSDDSDTDESRKQVGGKSIQRGKRGQSTDESRKQIGGKSIKIGKKKDDDADEEEDEEEEEEDDDEPIIDIPKTNKIELYDSEYEDD